MSDPNGTLQQQLQELSDEMIATTDRNLRAFRYGLEQTADAFRDGVNSYLFDGALTPQKLSRARALLDLQTEFQKQLNRARYMDLVKELIGHYADNRKAVIAQVMLLKPTERLSPPNSASVEQLKRIDYEHLKGLGEKTVREVASGVVQNTILGVSRGVIIDRIRSTITGNLVSHAGTYADTALVSFDRVSSLNIWRAAGIDRYKYRGPKDIKNRPFCAKYAGQTLTFAEIEKLDNGTTLKPVWRYGGGFGCRHIWSASPTGIGADEESTK